MGRVLNHCPLTGGRGGTPLRQDPAGKLGFIFMLRGSGTVFYN